VEKAFVISRQWCGLARPECADDYVAHLRAETFPQLSKMTGFVDARILRRRTRGGVEFLIVTQWESLTAIQQFAGENVEHAVVPESVQAMMLDYDRTVRHYDVLD
jgi:heme-degrading monooxygenase HmoA